MFLVSLILVFPSFVFFGVQSCSNLIDSLHDVAKVNGKVISISEVDAHMCEQTERLCQMSGTQYDPRQLEDSQIRCDVLNDIIQQHVSASEVTRANLTIPSEKTRDTILQTPTVVTLREPDDSFDQGAYVRLLSTQNIIPKQLKGNLRLELSR